MDSVEAAEVRASRLRGGTQGLGCDGRRALGLVPESCSRLFEDDQLVDIVDGVGLRLTIHPSLDWSQTRASPRSSH